MKCPACGEEVDGRKLFCTACRAPLHERDDILPEDEPATGERSEEQVGSSPGRAADTARREPAASEGNVGRRPLLTSFSRSLLLRLLITVLILGMLLGAIYLVSSLRRGRTNREPVGETRLKEPASLLHDAGGRATESPGTSRKLPAPSGQAAPKGTSLCAAAPAIRAGLSPG